MAELERPSSGRRCVQCGAEMAGAGSQDLCPKCLLGFALGTQPAIEPGGTVAQPHPATKSRGLPQPGDQFGHYTIVRLLGEGGMGAAFEAEDLDNGRRVALKVLSHTLDSPEARERFFREGRLAASINHPNSVYVFGTEEIGGTPVIAMELVAGGTLQERVGAHGPLPVGEAVDCVLQMIAGLEAAQRIGILHRDVKPSNCFRDADGTVKIGDFGLSISTAIRTEPALTATGAFLGTPAFCSPEQLRGDELNARSDMYSVGATLFYLLTGRTPFEGKNAVQLLATVLEQRAPSPRKFRREIPQGLAKAVVRCLEKQPGERFKTYDELRQVLAPYSSIAPTPATLGLRFLAACLDMVLIGIPGFILQWLVWGDPMGFMTHVTRRSPQMFAIMLLGWVMGLLYYALPEGLWGASLGKALCRLRVTGPDRNPPGIARAALRTSIYLILPPLPYLIVARFDPVGFMQTHSNAFIQVMSFSYYAMWGVLFCTARRRNGFAAVQDLLSNTRVILKTIHSARPVLLVSDESPPSVAAQPMIGPYHVLENIEKTTDGEWVLGFDTRLLRKVWIHVVTPGAPSISPHLRSLGRPSRLRWIAGRRAPEENWDAFEAVPGRPLVRLLSVPQPWSDVRYWLMDLAREIGAATKDGTLPVMLALDRVWITGDGRAKLLDFPAPGAATGDDAMIAAPPSSAPPTPDRYIEARHFLSLVASAALNGSAVATEPGGHKLTLPLPLHVRAFLNKLAGLANPDAIIAALEPLLRRVAVVSRWRRLGVVAACAAFPAFAGLSMMLGQQMLDSFQRSQPGVFQLSQLLQQRKAMRSSWLMKTTGGPDDRLVAIYIAAHFRATITNTAAWANLFTISLITPESRRFAEQSINEHPNPTEEEIREADAALKPLETVTETFNFTKQRWFPLAMIGGCLFIYVGIPSVILALAFRGGLVMFVLGIAVVRPDGTRASRLRMFWRSLIAWSPVLAAPVMVAILIPFMGVFPSAAGWAALVLALGLLSLMQRHRSLQDRLAGTWMVPR